MKRLIALVLAIAQPALSQDVPSEYAAAFRAFHLPGTLDGSDPAEQANLIAAMLPGIEGNWVPAYLLAVETSELAADLIVTACDRFVSKLSRTSRHGFEMRRGPTKTGVSTATRYDYGGANIFQRSLDETEWHAFLGYADKPDNVPPTVYSAAPLGPVFLYRPSPNILVFVPAFRGTIEIYARCT